MKFRIHALLISAITAAVLLTSCATSGSAKRPTYPTRLSPEMRTQFNEADALYNGGNYDAADKAYQSYITEFEYNELTDEAKFKRGEIRFRRKRYSEALPFYRSASSGTYNPHITPKAHLRAAEVLYHLKRYGEVIDEISRIRREDTPPEIRVRADSLGMLAARKAGWPGKRNVRFALFLIDDYIDLGGDESRLADRNNVVARNDALRFVRYWVDDDTVTQADLDALPKDSYRKKPSGGYLLYKEAQVAQRYGNLDEANRLYKKYVHSYPKHEYYAKANEMLSETSARTGKASFKVGVILPNSGKYRIYGESVRRGIECALGLYEPCRGPEGIQMVIRDSQGSPTLAAKAVDELAEEDVQVIIGPLLSATVTSAASRAQSLGIPLITISQRSGIASIGNYIFRNSVTSKSQVDSLVNYTSGKRGMKRYFILYPDNNKGEEFRFLFVEAVQKAGGRIVGSKSYNPQSQDLAVQLRGMHSQDDRIDLTQAGKVRYDAIFLPGSAWAAAFFAPMLAMMGMENVTLLGTMRWNDPGLIMRGGKYLDGAIFVQAFDKSSPNIRVRSFVDKFRAAYNVEPTLLEGLGYDSMKMILKSSGQGAHKRNTIRDALSKLIDYEGVTGRISFDPEGNAIRKLNVMRIQNGTAKKVN